MTKRGESKQQKTEEGGEGESLARACLEKVDARCLVVEQGGAKLNIAEVQ